MAITANPGATIKLSWQQNQGTTTLYPQAVIKNSAGTTMDTVSLTHDSNGLYAGTTALLVDEGTYSCQFLVYTDSGHTSLSGVDEIVHETISIQRSWRPSFGGGGEATIPKKILDPLLKLLKDISDRQDKLEIELAKKSEFNPNRDVVKTDIKPTSLRFLVDKLDKLKNPVVKVDTTQITSFLKKMDKRIEKADFTPNERRIINAISNIRFDTPKISLDSVEQMIDEHHRQSILEDRKVSRKIDGLMRIIQPFLKINNILERFKSEKTP
uniref:Uncharacterized protein n=1 Tax=viral metagenome TaxID=1070528 RepID=A0A6H1ZKU1_9ZZZZ